jgi:hypothetical protein
VNRDLRIAAAGAAAGVLVTTAGAAALWPSPRFVQAQPPALPTVSAAPTSVGAPTDQPSLQQMSAEQSPSASPTDWSGHEPADAPTLPDAAPAGTGQLPDATAVRCPAATVRVSDTQQLQQALAEAKPGDSIALADGTYTGEFTTARSGTRQQPIFLCGGSGAVLDGGDVEGGYVMHLDHVADWRLVGFTVRNGQKGVMADGTSESVIQGLNVEHIGDEGIHLRDDSTDNVVLDNAVSDTGLRRAKYGEGIYVGSSVNNWCEYNRCQPDRSDRNVIKGNTISHTTAEAIDIKEATTGGVVEQNTFDGSAVTGADSWVDVKGNNWLIQGNHGTNSPNDGFQTHQILDGWGDHNLFRGNVAAVNGPGYGFSLTPAEHNVVTCDNTAIHAGQGLSNVTCS